MVASVPNKLDESEKPEGGNSTVATAGDTAGDTLGPDTVDALHKPEERSGSAVDMPNDDLNDDNPPVYKAPSFADENPDDKENNTAKSEPRMPAPDGNKASGGGGGTDRDRRQGEPNEPAEGQEAHFWVFGPGGELVASDRNRQGQNEPEDDEQGIVIFDLLERLNAQASGTGPRQPQWAHPPRAPTTTTRTAGRGGRGDANSEEHDMDDRRRRILATFLESCPGWSGHGGHSHGAARGQDHRQSAAPRDDGSGLDDRAATSTRPSDRPVGRIPGTSVVNGHDIGEGSMATFGAMIRLIWEELGVPGILTSAALLAGAAVCMATSPWIYYFVFALYALGVHHYQDMKERVSDLGKSLDRAVKDAAQAKEDAAQAKRDGAQAKRAAVVANAKKA
ncbi:hypothetical protein AYO20_09108 [Fonsecaea nubica]|uniref:Uncharacterized protein n=1 Tax=Fonsecaea nubica TaxID=856822 RepID=A0A178CK65_9EURO|nr:hypothetical protein AYO20_09108 [Fonsecaea nubica]OAL29724.1 hypothetical protein AYO20_09108 [Fonsecaea nubica]